MSFRKDDTVYANRPLLVPRFSIRESPPYPPTEKHFRQIDMSESGVIVAKKDGRYHVQWRNGGEGWFNPKDLTRERGIKLTPQSPQCNCHWYETRGGEYSCALVRGHSGEHMGWPKQVT